MEVSQLKPHEDVCSLHQSEGSPNGVESYVLPTPLTHSGSLLGA